MAFARSTLAGLRRTARGNIAARLPGADLSLRRSYLVAIADILAGMLWSVYGYLDWLAGVLLPDTLEPIYLARWMAIFGLTPLQAVKAGGNAEFTGLVGAAIPAGTLLQ